MAAEEKLTNVALDKEAYSKLLELKTRYGAKTFSEVVKMLLIKTGDFKK